jgi:hypothetical protein
MCKGLLFCLSVSLVLFGDGSAIKFTGLGLLALSLISIAAGWLANPSEPV